MGSGVVSGADADAGLGAGADAGLVVPLALRAGAVSSISQRVCTVGCSDEPEDGEEVLIHQV